jgi:hypothetical protein
MISPLQTCKSAGRLATVAAIVLYGLLGGGCASTPPKFITEFYLESPKGTGIEFTMPISKLVMHRQVDPFTNATNVLDVSEGTIGVTVDPNQPPVPTPCILVQFDREGQRKIYQQTIAENFGKRIFMFANGVPVAVHPITAMVTDGPLFMFTEVPGTETSHDKFVEFIKDLHESALRVQEMKRKQ